jgi:hypothetical protein
MPPLPGDLPDCWWCGGGAEYLSLAESEDGTAIFQVVCGLCGAASPEGVDEVAAVQIYRDGPGRKERAIDGHESLP